MPTAALEPSIDAETSHLCHKYDGAADNSELLRLPCYQPTRGSVLVVHIPNVGHSFSLCAVEVYGTIVFNYIVIYHHEAEDK